jgi:sugar O-acyltransferase (sialic acid O-acetyltransferase NeuD family)
MIEASDGMTRRWDARRDGLGSPSYGRVARPVTGCVVLGAGGHAAVLLDALGDLDADLLVLDPDESRWNTDFAGVPVVGGDDRLSELAASGVSHFVVGVGATTASRLRTLLFEKALACGLLPLTVRHATAIVSDRATIEPGAQILAGAIVSTNARIGANAIVNTGAVVDHDCLVGEHAHVATGARLAGDVRIGARSHVGVGASIRQGIRVAEDATIGAGAVVVKDVAAGTTVVGVPARPV